MSTTYLSVKDAAERLHVSDRTIRHYLGLGYFPDAIKKGPGRNSEWLIPEADVTSFDEKRRNLPNN